jgi:hypothetical protein
VPKTVTIELDPSWKPKTAKDKQIAASVKPVQVSYVSAMEAVKLSGGMYRIKPEGAAPLPSAPSLQELPTEELKRMYVAMGGRMSDKPLKRSEIITFITQKMDALEVIEDES